MRFIFWAPVLSLCMVVSDTINDPKLYNVRKLTFSGDHSHPKFSSDKRYIYFSGRGDVYGKKDCDEIYRLDLKYANSGDTFKAITRVSPGFGHSTRISIPTNATNTNTSILYQSSFETILDTPAAETDAFCAPALTCTDLSCIEYLDGTSVYNVNIFGSPLSRLSETKENGNYHSSPSQYNDVILETKKCKWNVGTPPAEKEMTCLVSPDGKTSLPLADGSKYYDFASFGTNDENQTVVFVHGRGFVASTGTDADTGNKYTTANTEIYRATIDKDGVASVPEVFLSKYVNTGDATKTRSRLFPRAFQKSSSIIFTEIDDTAEKNGVIYEVLSKDGTPAAMTDPAVSSMQADLNPEETQILFVRREILTEKYQVYIANLNPEVRPPVTFETIPAKSDIKDLPYLQRKSYVSLDGKIGRVRLNALGGDLFFEHNPDKTEKTKCKQIYHVNSATNDYSSPRLISTGLANTDGFDFFEDTQKSNKKSIVYSSNFMKNKAKDGNVNPCDPVGCDLLNPELDTDSDLKAFCDGATYTKYLDPGMDLYKVNMFGNFEKRLTKDDTYDGEPTVSADGKKVVFTKVTKDDEGGLDIKLVFKSLDPAKENEKPTPLTEDDGYYGGASWSRDGKKIVFHGTKPEEESSEDFMNALKKNLVDISVSEIFIINGIPGGESTQLTYDKVFSQNPTITPDGKKIIYDRTENGKHSLWQMDLDGKNQMKISDDSMNACKLSFSRKKQNSTVFVGDIQNEDQSWSNQINFGIYKPHDPINNPSTTTVSITVSTLSTTIDGSLTTTTNPSVTTTTVPIIITTPVTTVSPNKTTDKPDSASGLATGLIPSILAAFWLLRNGF